ncbi:MAG: glycosyltransferase family 4 protein [Gemmatimonadota bacterium]
MMAAEGTSDRTRRRPSTGSPGEGREPASGRLRFAMFTTFYPPYSFGGDAIGVQRLARALVKRGHQVTVFHDSDAFDVLHSGPVPEAPESHDGVEVRPLSSRLGPVSALLTQQTGRPIVHGRRIRQLLERGRFDVIQFNNVSLVGGPGLLQLGDALKVYEAHEHWLVCPSHVLWRHGRELCTGRQCLRCVLHYHRPPQLWRYTGYLERQLRHVDLFIAKSEFSRDKHAEFGFPRPMDVLPYFLPDAEDAVVSGAAAGRVPAHPRPYFLFSGRLEKIKGLDEVLPLFRGPSGADLLVAGDGNHAPELRRQAAGAERIRFLGRVPPERLAQYYRGAIALLVPSLCFETFGIILIEAFRQGTPVIARDIGPFPEIVRRCGGGELFRGAAELQAAVRRLQEDPKHRERLAAAAARGFIEHWSESAVVPRYLELLGKAAESSGRERLAAAIAMEAAA